MSDQEDPEDVDDIDADDTDEQDESSSSDTESSSQSFTPDIPFSSGAFIKGLAAGIFILCLLFGWAWLRTDDTIARQMEKLPSKTAVIDRNYNPAQKPDPKLANLPPAVDGAALVKEAQNRERPKTALSPAPAEGLYEQTQRGLLPVSRMTDGETPFDAYKRPYTPAAGKIPLAVVFVNVGLSKIATQAMIRDFDPNMSLVFSPYSVDTSAQAQAARDAGHEIWLSMPLENETYPDPDPGPRTLFINASLEQNQGRLFSTMTDLIGYVGVVTGKNHKYRPEDVDGTAFIRQVFGRGLALVDGNTSRPFFAREMADRNHYPYAQAQEWLNADLRPAEIRAQLSVLPQKAVLSDNGYILFVEPTPLNLKYIKAWVRTIDKDGLELAPLSAIADKKS